MKSILRLILAAAVCPALLLASQAVRAADMRDTVVKVSKSTGLLDVELSVRMYVPAGNGPFPLVVINHGKAPGNAALQEDRAFYFQSREFVKRGYAVVVPTRQGFGSSGGTYREAACNIAETGELQADDIDVTIQYAKTLPYIDGSRIVVIGQSEGGLATMALGERNIPGVLGLIDMAGGLRKNHCEGWQSANVAAYAKYGATAHAPALFMYGDNDSYWGTDLPRQIYDAYVHAGGRATWVDYGVFESDSHSTFSRRTGMPLWMPAYQQFFVSLGLPFDVKTSPHGSEPAMGDIDDADAIPNLLPASKKAYDIFLSMDPHEHRAFAISPDGHCGYARGDQAKEEALANCSKRTQLGCTLYALDETVVYHAAPPLPASRTATGAGE
jgi:dienelactone hydrolase